MKKIDTKDAPQAIGPYSQAVACGDFLFVSGQIPINPASGKVEETTIEGQTKQVLANIDAILRAAGTTKDRVVRAEIYLKDLSHFATVNTLYADYFSSPIKPARHAFQVSKLPLDVLIEITCIAYLK